MQPITRKEMYLAAMSGDYSGTVPEPVTRMDYYMAYAVGAYGGVLPRPIRQQEFYWAYICGATDIELPAPVTRIDMYLAAICGGMILLPRPITREEIYLAKIAKQSEAVVKSAAGKEIVLTDSLEAPFEDFHIYGHTTRDGTPTPENPIELVSAGDKGSIEMSVTDGEDSTQMLTLSTPNGLPGIPVTSGGNYTDENGQQWICNEIDLRKEKYIKRMDEIELDGTELKFSADSSNAFWNLPLYSSPGCVAGTVYCNYFPSDCFSVNLNYDFVWTKSNMMEPYFAAINELNDFIKSKYDEGNPVKIMYRIDPVEIDFPANELTAYRALHTNYPTTTIYNDEDCWMDVSYKAKPISQYSETMTLEYLKGE